MRDDCALTGAIQAATIGNPDNRRQPKQPSLETRTTVGNPSNRRSGESRNPGNHRGESVPATGGSGFRLSPERRFYAGIVLVRQGFSRYFQRLPVFSLGRGGFVTRPGSGAGMCWLWHTGFPAFPCLEHRTGYKPAPTPMVIPVIPTNVESTYEPRQAHHKTVVPAKAGIQKVR